MPSALLIKRSPCLLVRMSPAGMVAADGGEVEGEQLFEGVVGQFRREYDLGTAIAVLQDDDPG